MIIAIFSDLHDNLKNWKKLNKFLKEKDIKTLLFAGDLTKQSTFKQIKKDFQHEIFFVSGNADLFVSKELPESRIIEIENTKIAISHFSSNFKKENNDYDFCFYGHTHKPWIKKHKNTYFINPGSLDDPNFSSFALLNTNNKYINLQKL